MDDNTLRQLSIVVADIMKFETMMHQLYERTISQKLPNLATSSVLAVEEGEDTPEGELSSVHSDLYFSFVMLSSLLAFLSRSQCKLGVPYLYHTITAFSTCHDTFEAML